MALPLSLLLTFMAMRCSATASTTSRSWRSRWPSASWLTTRSCSWRTRCAGWSTGERALQAAINSAQEISFTILSMTISLAAVFIPLVFMSGLVGRIFREFAITIVVAILASGLVSLTLTPLMCARMLKDRGPGAKKTWMERVVGGVGKACARCLWQSRSGGFCGGDGSPC